jgi:hypothetical protein
MRRHELTITSQLAEETLVKPGSTAVEVEVIRRLLLKAGRLVSESHGLSYALVMALASTPWEAHEKGDRRPVPTGP